MKILFIARLIASLATACAWSSVLHAQIPDSGIPELLSLRDKLLVHPEATAAELRVRARQARLDAARAIRNSSTIFLDAEEVRGAEPGTANVKLGLEHVFIPHAQRTAEIAVAEAELAFATAQLHGARMRLDSRLTRAFVEATVHRRIADRLSQEDSLLQRAEITLNARFAVGEARYIDVIRLRTERLRVQADLLDASTDVSRALLEIAAITGERLDFRILRRIPLKLPSIPSDVDALIHASPAGEAARALRLQSLAQLAVAEAQGGRLVSGQLGLQRFGDNEASIGPVVGLAVSLPLFNKRSISASVSAARLDTLAAGSNVVAAQARMRSDIESAFAEIAATAQRMLTVDERLIAAAREERQAALTAYATGDMTLAELLDFERSLSRAEVQLLGSFDTSFKAWDRIHQLLSGESILRGEQP